ncbi:MAG: DUF456 domain-containing protein [Candidatus Omnitrophica bacterium]|nr:DUF456 domain-containing protein [Candidatus Omnitrophota bacterium]MBU4589458.1 DUF456 domain-containing protein [Candidatus Omnitrophota bacterium]
MEILALSILLLASVTGFIAIFFTTFGTLIILLGSVFYALLTDFILIDIRTLLILFTLYLCGEVLEYVFIIIGGKKLGASNAAIVGALVGGILGAIVGSSVLGVGLILGTFLGIFLGAFLVELLIQKDLVKSLKAGLGGVLGRVGSILVKIIIAIIMIFIMLSSTIPHAS